MANSTTKAFVRKSANFWLRQYFLPTHSEKMYSATNNKGTPICKKRFGKLTPSRQRKKKISIISRIMHAPVFLDTSFTNTSNSQMTTFLLKIYAIPVEKAMRSKAEAPRKKPQETSKSYRSHKKQKKICKTAKSQL
ncbi:MAG: hypothetical protein J6X67_02035 [Treponema sp.]|nr:hypothetical protein [Treponema sp.]